MKILAISGSLQAHSANLALLQAMAVSAPPDVEVIVFDGLRDLPHFNPDLQSAGPPDTVTRWRSALAASDALVIACPEYGFSLPGALKNGIDWAIGSGELEAKVVAVTAAVPAAGRGLRGLQALRETLSAVRATIVGGETIVKGDGFEAAAAALLRELVQTVRVATLGYRDDRHPTGDADTALRSSANAASSCACSSVERESAGSPRSTRSTIE